MSQLGLVPSRPMVPVTNGRSSGTAALPSSALATPAPSRSATAMHLIGAHQRARADEHRDLLARVQHVGGALADRVAGARRAAADSRRPSGLCRARAAALDGLHLLNVVRDDDAGDACARRARCGTRDRPGAASARAPSACWTYSLATSLNSVMQVDLLLVGAAQRRRAPAGRRSRRPAGDPSSRRKGRSADESRPGPRSRGRRRPRR